MTRPPIPSQVWHDATERARQQQKRCVLYADALLDLPLAGPSREYAEELRNVRRQAALLDAEGFAQYARRCHEAWADAVAHETQATA